MLGLDQFKSSKDILDLDLQQLTNEVDGLESLAHQMETLTFSDMVDDGLFLVEESKRKPLKRQKGGRRKKKQAKHHKKQGKFQFSWYNKYINLICYLASNINLICYVALPVG